MTDTDNGQTNRLLGYPEDARLLIVNADDFGMCHSNIAATMRAIREGIVASTTVMAPCSWAPLAMQLLQQDPDIPFGVHLTLVSEHATYRWGPLAAKDRVPSLLDEAGYFYSETRREELLARAKTDEVELEFRAQIDTILRAGLSPTHLDWHCLADGGREDIFELSVRLAEEFGLAVRVFQPYAVEMCRRAGRPVSDHGTLDSYRLPTAGKAEQYAALLRALPVGLSEWAVHPGLGDAEAQAMEPDGWDVRKADFDFVVSPEARQIVEEEGITLLDYRPLQARWRAQAQ